MSDMLTKANLFPPSPCYLFNRSQKEQQIGSIKCCGFKGFPLKAKPVQALSLGSGFLRKKEGVPLEDRKSRIRTHSGLRIGSAQKWWEKGLQANMIEVTSAQQLVNSLANAGDKLVVVAFFSPGCGGCRALHPKLCQLAEMNPEVQFLFINYEEQKSMCYSLNVHVLPFFRFYRGSHGRLCSFSCTNATIKKFKDALAKHTPARCSLGPTKGLEEKELVALAANKDLSFTYTPKPAELEPPPAEEQAPSPLDPSVPLLRPMVPSNSAEGKTMVTVWR